MNNVNELRAKWGKTQSEMADIMQCTQGAIAKYESGTQSPTIERARLLIDWAKANRSEILTLDDVYKLPQKVTA